MEILLNSMVKAVKLEPTFEGYGFVGMVVSRFVSRKGLIKFVVENASGEFQIFSGENLERV